MHDHNNVTPGDPEAADGDGELNDFSGEGGHTAGDIGEDEDGRSSVLRLAVSGVPGPQEGSGFGGDLSAFPAWSGGALAAMDHTGEGTAGAADELLVRALAFDGGVHPSISFALMEAHAPRASARGEAEDTSDLFELL